jgi:hypothetical protein
MKTPMLTNLVPTAVRSLALRWCLLAGLMAAPFAGKAANVLFEGEIGYDQIDDVVTLTADTVVNYDRSGKSGTLRMQLWATLSPYYSGRIKGYVMGTTVLGRLSGGWEFYDIYEEVSFVSPPPGFYYVTMTVEEYTRSGWIIRDSIDLDTIEVESLLKLEGNVDWYVGPDTRSISARPTTLTFDVESVVNYQNSASRTLRLQVWATKKPYAGNFATPKGSVLGTLPLGNLDGNSSLDGIADGVSFKKPAKGQYYTMVTLEEKGPKGWEIRDFVETGTYSVR